VGLEEAEPRMVMIKARGEKGMEPGGEGVGAWEGQTGRGFSLHMRLPG
jgi:hypothetical protein